MEFILEITLIVFPKMLRFQVRKEKSQTKPSINKDLKGTVEENDSETRVIQLENFIHQVEVFEVILKWMYGDLY